MDTLTAPTPSDVHDVDERPHWRCPDCGAPCSCDPPEIGARAMPHVRCGRSDA